MYVLVGRGVKVGGAVLVHFGLAAIAAVAWEAVLADLGTSEEDAKVGVEMGEKLTSECQHLSQRLVLSSGRLAIARSLLPWQAYCS